MISKIEVKYYSSLKRKKCREQEQKFIVEGLRLCEEAFESEYRLDKLLYCPARVSSARANQLIEKCKNAAIPVDQLDTKSLRQISDTVHSQGILGIVQIKRFNFEQLLSGSPKRLVALDHIHDPGNLGAIIRSASWFGADAILLSQNSVEFTNPKVVRSSMGCVFHLPILDQLNFSSELPQLNELGYSVFVADIKESIEYTKADFSKKWVIVFGNEISGVDEEVKKMASGFLHIPGRGKGESLNVAVAAGIILAETTRSNQ